jgi:EAL domain-containing protein (putative c-di-GMP-specific phosphodiesterase class I)
MRRTFGKRLFQAAEAVAGELRRPQHMVFLPAVTLGAFWLGGETVLILTALGIPLVFMMAGAFRFQMPSDRGGEEGQVARPQAIAALDRALAEGAVSGRRTGCVVVQFDDAETLVDRHGRAVQAEVLALCADRIAGALRQGDSVARLEGGGFAVALAPVRRLDLEVMVQIAVRLQAALEPPHAVGGERIYVTASVGFCQDLRAPQPTGKALLDAAQVAADEARRHGPGAIRAYAPEMARTRADRDALRDRLEQALDNGEIRPFFQPQVSTDTGALSGFEVLARWQHPDRGLLSPAEFLPAIELAGLADRLGEVMLSGALGALTQWDKAGLAVPRVGVNFSAAELRDPRLAERLKWELDRFDLAPGRLSVEILETVVALADNDVVVRNIAQLAAHGCGIDLDDFGTGHAGITNIRRFSVRRLKIDRSFVTRVDEDREQQKMVSAVLSLAEQLGLETLAEGVETAGEHAMLAQLGCGHVQGYAIGRPMPMAAVPGWIAQHGTQLAKAPLITHRAR